MNSTMAGCNSSFQVPKKDKNGMFKCSLCSKSIKTWTSFKRHIDDHKGKHKTMSIHFYLLKHTLYQTSNTVIFHLIFIFDK